MAPQRNKPTLADDLIEALGEAVAHAEGRLDLYVRGREDARVPEATATAPTSASTNPNTAT